MWVLKAIFISDTFEINFGFKDCVEGTSIYLNFTHVIEGSTLNTYLHVNNSRVESVKLLRLLVVMVMALSSRVVVIPT